LHKADNYWKNSELMRDVIQLIANSAVVICDLTGLNPNVLYETGIAHTLGKNVILVTQNENDVPFDVRHIRYIHYKKDPAGRTKLANDILSRVKTVLN